VGSQVSRRIKKEKSKKLHQSQSPATRRLSDIAKKIHPFIQESETPNSLHSQSFSLWMCSKWALAAWKDTGHAPLFGKVLHTLVSV